VKLKAYALVFALVMVAAFVAETGWGP